MLRTSGLWLVVLCFVLGVLGAAYAADAPSAPAGAKAGCADCPKGGDCADCPKAGACAKGGGGCSGTCAKAKAGEAPTAPALASSTPAACPKCGMVGELCPQCSEHAKQMLTQMAGEMCPDCEPGALCAICKSAVESALAKLPKLAAAPVHSEVMRVAYIAGKVSDGMETLIARTVEEAGKQGLLGEHTYVGDLYPDVMAKGYGPDTTVYSCVSLEEGAQVAAPLQVFEIPAGNYLQIDHWGDYAKIGETWMAAFAYAELHGMTFGTGPAGEVYLTDPSTAPMDKWLTQVYIPLANDGATAPDAPSVPAVPSA